jgi:hypothetical protein
MAIIVPIVTKYFGAGVSQATKSFAGLQNQSKATTRGLSTVSKVGIASFAALGAAASRFGQNAVKAAAADQQSQVRLAKTLQNVTKATEAQTAAVESFITTQQFATGISDNQLRPALATLVRATGDVTKAQDLLKLGLDVSAGSGRDLTGITLALARAQGGQFTGLQRLGIVIPENIKKSKDFAKVQEYLNTLFGGQAAVAAGTYQGKLAILRERFGEVQESIGAVLLPALTKLVGYISTNIMPNLEVFINALTGKESLGSSFTRTQEQAFIFGNVVRAVVQTIVSYIPYIAAFGAALLATFVVAKIAAAAAAIIKIIKGIIFIYEGLILVASGASIATAFATGGTSVAAGALGAAAAVAALGVAFVAINAAVSKYKKNVADLPAVNVAPDGVASGSDAYKDIELPAVDDDGKPKGKQSKSQKAAAKAAKEAAAMAKVVAAASKAAASALGKMNDKLAAARERLAAAKEAFAEFRDGVRDSIIGLMDFGKAADAESGTFLENFRKQATGIVQFAEKIKKLISMGLSEAGIQQVLSAGAEAGTKIADELIAGGAGAISETNKLLVSVNAAAEQLGESGAKAFYQAGITQGQAMVNGMLAAIKKSGFRIVGGFAALPANLQKALNAGKLTEKEVTQLNNLLRGVPALAEGGIVNKPTLALIGEAGPEAVIPLSGRNSSMGNTYNVTVNAGMGSNGAQIGREIVDAIKKFERASGPVFASA